MAVKIRSVEKKDKQAITDLVKEFVESLNQPFYESLWLTLLDSYFVGLEIKELASEKTHFSSKSNLRVLFSLAEAS